MQNLDFKVIYLATGEHRRIRIANSFRAGDCHQSFERLAQDGRLFVSHDLPAAVSITHQTRSICHQNKALSVVQNLAGAITLSLQLSLISLQATDIEHQPAVLRDASVGPGNGKSVNQDMNCAAIFALEDGFAISESALALHLCEQLAVIFGRRKNFFPRIAVQQLVAAAAPEHTNQSIIDFNEASVRTAEKQAFLNIVEKL